MCFQSSVTGFVHKSEYLFCPPFAIFKNTLYYYLKDKGGNWGCERGPIVASSFLRTVQLPQMTGGTLGGASTQIQIQFKIQIQIQLKIQIQIQIHHQCATPQMTGGTLGGACLDTNTNTIENTNRNRQTNTPPSDQSGTPPNDRGTLGGASAQIQIQI